MRIIKMSVNLGSDVVEVLKTLARKRCSTMTDVIRQAIGTEVFLQGVRDNHGTVLIEDKNGRVRQLVLR
jgi:predicted transcriptional regulator